MHICLVSLGVSDSFVSLCVVCSETIVIDDGPTPSPGFASAASASGNATPTSAVPNGAAAAPPGAVPPTPLASIFPAGLSTPLSPRAKARQTLETELRQSDDAVGAAEWTLKSARLELELAEASERHIDALLSSLLKAVPPV
jgi:hypothetical protein